MTDSRSASSDLIKTREVGFNTLFHPDPDQAGSAKQLLEAIQLIEQVERTDEHTLRVTYSIARITLKIIESTLIELGFHLDSALLPKLKRALYYFTEETQCINLGITHHTKDTQQLFINEFRHGKHGCRDERPRHLRHLR
ncbi:MAG: hypothetical protein A2V90_07990 [Gammaproteobacteria bacterium RBG_16_57_12]|nr:MAG: hypothetical protein A2V90_07990 [Gammaproteobacteria bacterium RBG_16_57_12]